MRECKLTATATMFLIVFAGTNGRADWQTFRPADKSFAIEFPSVPEKQTEQLKTANGIVVVRACLVGAKAGAPGYFLSYSELQSDSPRPNKVQQQLWRAKQAALAGSGGKLNQEKKIQLNGHPGLDLLITTAKGDFFRARIYAARDRVYQIFLIGSRSQVHSNDAERFLRSFQLSPK